MTKPIIHFAHANGFPAPSYRQFFSGLTDEFDIQYLSMHGHDPLYPVTNNWPHLVDELANYLQGRYQEPVIGLGHSLGGILTFLVAIKHPHLFRAIVVLDSPLLSPLRSKIISWAKHLGIMDQRPAVKYIPKRRIHWQSQEEAYEYFRSKDVFKRFDEKALWDYVLFGTENDAERGGVRLAFDRQVEYQIFRHLPDHLPSFRGQLKVPAGLISVENSYAVSARDRNFVKKHFKMKLATTKGSHLFPFEHPQEAAKVCRKMIGHLLESRYNS